MCFRLDFIAVSLDGFEGPFHGRKMQGKGGKKQRGVRNRERNLTHVNSAVENYF